MKKVFYSEDLHKYFDSEKECVAAETAEKEKLEKAKALREERATHAKEVEAAYKKYLDLRAKFIEDYGYYHMSLTEKDLPKTDSIFDLFDPWFFC